MKEIKLLSHLFVESSTGHVDFEAAKVKTQAARDNGKKVIVGGLFVEREIEAIIGFYLYPGPTITEQQEFVAGEILGSDAFSFSYKKRLIMSLVNRKEWLKGEAKTGFDKELRNVISLRNAFAHGNIIVRDSAVVLEYFEGSKKTAELNDEFWTKLEASFNTVVRHVETIKDAAGIPRPRTQGAA